MGSVELLSREGELAIAKRIEAGREAMIAGLCESPLTFRAIISGGTSSTRARSDIIDLDATYAGPDAKLMPTPVIGRTDGESLNTRADQRCSEASSIAKKPAICGA